MTQQTYRKMMGYFYRIKNLPDRLGKQDFYRDRFFQLSALSAVFVFFRRYFPAAGGTGTGGFICGSVGVT